MQEKIVICLAYYSLGWFKWTAISPENLLPYKCFYKPPQDSYKNSFLSQHFHCDSKSLNFCELSIQDSESFIKGVVTTVNTVELKQTC